MTEEIKINTVKNDSERLDLESELDKKRNRLKLLREERINDNIEFRKENENLHTTIRYPAGQNITSHIYADKWLKKKK